MEYIAYLHKEPDSDYGVTFPDFPGCVTAGTSLEDARVMAQEALELHIEGMVADGDDLPRPSSLDDLADDPDLVGGVAFAVSVNVPDPSVRVNITLPQSVLDAIDSAAKEEGSNRSAFMVRASLQEVRRGGLFIDPSEARLAKEMSQQILKKIDTLKDRMGAKDAEELRRMVEARRRARRSAAKDKHRVS